VTAAFLHAPPTGARFTGPDLGAWYASGEVKTSAAEVGHHLRREVAARHVPRLLRIYRAYSARLDGDHLRSFIERRATSHRKALAKRAARKVISASSMTASD